MNSSNYISSVQSKRLLMLLIFFGFTTQSEAQSTFTTSNLPIILLETFGQEILDEPRIIAQMSVINGEKGSENNINDLVNGYEGFISIEIRGFSSQIFPKKQYRLETQFENGENRNVSLLGLPVENDWVLAAPFSDKTLMRNVLAFELSRRLGRYAPRTRYCELVLNGEYMGVYVLTEKIKRDKNRVDIAKLTQDDIEGDELTGGYLMIIDRYASDACYGWNTDVDEVRVQHEDPKCEEVTTEQHNYIVNYIADFENALYDSNFENPDEGYRKYLDISSAVDYLIVNEIAKNIDAYRLSTFFSKDKDSKGGKIQFGPVWDFNIAFGNANYYGGYRTDSLEASDKAWWGRLLQDSIFTQAISNRWVELRKNELCNVKIVNLIDSIANHLNEAQVRNFDKWPILGNHIWPNHYIGESYTDEVDYLRSWTLERIAQLDEYFAGGNIGCSAETENLSNVFPNPFDNSITCAFSLEKKGRVSIRIFDLNGKLVYTLMEDEMYDEGNHIRNWQSDISNISPTMYIMMIEIDGNVVSREKIVKLHY